MPLSDEENRLLAQMEQALAAEDPRFAATLRGRRLERAARVRTGAAVLGIVLGLALLLGGAMAQQTILGIVGFVVMLACTTALVATLRGRRDPAAAPRTDNIIDGGFLQSNEHRRDDDER